MKNVWAVATRELRSYFLSPLAYVVIALFLALSGYLFALILANGREASIRGLISNVSVLYLFIVPAISMRLLSEEMPVDGVEVVRGLERAEALVADRERLDRIAGAAHPALERGRRGELRAVHRVTAPWSALVTSRRSGATRSGEARP